MDIVGAGLIRRADGRHVERLGEAGAAGKQKKQWTGGLHDGQYAQATAGVHVRGGRIGDISYRSKGLKRTP
jgi:hypothetical protein